MLLLLLFAKACVQIHVLFNRYKTRYVLLLLGYILLLNYYITPCIATFIIEVQELHLSPPNIFHLWIRIAVSMAVFSVSECNESDC